MARKPSDLPRLSEVAEEYFAAREVKLGEGHKDIKTARMRLGVFLDLIGDHQVDTYTSADLQAFIALMTHWPAQERNRPSDKSPREILAANADLRFKPLKRSALEDGYVTAARSIIRYKMTDYEYSDPFLNAKLTYPETAAPKQSTEPLSSEQKSRIFRTGVEGGLLDEAILPLLGDLTGRRLGLLVHLQGSDLREKYPGVFVAQTSGIVLNADGVWRRVPIKTDQIVFLKNDSTLGVKNGMLAKVVEAAPGRTIAEVGEGEARRRIEIDQRTYRNLDHRYATTIHKSQGATVDGVRVLASLSLNRHLTYVAMTRHRENVTLYYGKRSFAFAGGLTKILSRRDAKETTLDYTGGRFYAQALSFANSRGLHLVRVGRTLLRDRLDWTLRQQARLAELGEKLRSVGVRLGVFDRQASTPVHSTRKAEPMVKGVTSFALTITDAAEAKLQSDKALAKQWDLVSDRIRRVYAEPETAFRAMRIEAAFSDPSTRSDRLRQIEQAPASYGPLRGRTGILASSADKNDRRIAKTNVPALRRDLERYFVMREQVMKRLVVEEAGQRQRASIDIPALSPRPRPCSPKCGMRSTATMCLRRSVSRSPIAWSRPRSTLSTGPSKSVLANGHSLARPPWIQTDRRSRRP
ncbi:BID domain-containing protein [Aquibium sp. ELW1220]|uniref:BID domain-containing protein n=1 Tax=Aquibium sp. ELW1220 TaxID=2976766 RepID=UPI0025B0ACE8|nr:BID domain-containing protein [Aquibium sp. ELW1220]MDN2583763.1 BID domain-containing protein [Aquibium sp. ELW1220]